MLAEGFWAAFWPNLASTFIGVGLGVPVALQLNRLNVSHSDRVRVAADKARVVEALASLRRSLQKESPPPASFTERARAWPTELPP